MRNSPGSFTGAVLGTICLIGGIGLWFWAPEFSGFFDRGHSEATQPVWILLIILAVVNYIYAAVSNFIQVRAAKASDNPQAPGQQNGGRKA